MLSNANSGSAYSWTTSMATTVPVALSRISGELSVYVVIDKLGNLPTGNDIPLDGSTTLEMVYL